jgi:hypothetical protein
MILNDAQKFIVVITALITCTSFKHYILNAQKLIDKDVNVNKLNYSLNFFKQIKNEPKNFDSFVYEFNSQIQDLHIAAKKENVFVPVSPLAFGNDKICINCKGKDYYECEGSMHCNLCGLIKRSHLAIAWSDVSRVHAAPIYTYDRKVQFKEWILQYQGKCNTDYSLVNKIKCPLKKITKIEFLNLLKSITKQRTNLEQVHSLYYHIYKITPPDLSRIENNLLQDFVNFNKIYEKIGTVHIPHQFLLFQFLNRYGFKTTSDDVLLPSDSIIQYPPDECVKTFKQCGWALFN